MGETDDFSVNWIDLENTETGDYDEIEIEIEKKSGNSNSPWVKMFINIPTSSITITGPGQREVTQSLLPDINKKQELLSEPPRNENDDLLTSLEMNTDEQIRNSVPATHSGTKVKHKTENEKIWEAISTIKTEMKEMEKKIVKKVSNEKSNEKLKETNDLLQSNRKLEYENDKLKTENRKLIKEIEMLQSQLEKLKNKNTTPKQNFQFPSTTNCSFSTPQQNTIQQKTRANLKTYNLSNPSNYNNTAPDGNSPRNKKPKVFILGDSMVKGLKGHLMSRKKKVTVHSISGATTSAFKHHIKPILEENPDELIIHGGTNDLTKDVTNTVENIIYIINEIKKWNPEIKIAISGIIQRGDRQWLNEKIDQINKILEKVSNENGSVYINNDTISPQLLNNSKLHLNINGDKLLATNFIRFLKNSY